MKKYILFFFLPVLLIGLHACDEGRIYENAVVATGEGRTVKMTGRISGVDKWSGALPAGYFFGFIMDWGIIGIWMAFPFGLTTAGILYYLRFNRDTKLK